MPRTSRSKRAARTRTTEAPSPGPRHRPAVCEPGSLRQMSNPVTQSYATAVHESSHAVCALSFGLPVDRLSIRADGLTGVCTFRHPTAHGGADCIRVPCRRPGRASRCASYGISTSRTRTREKLLSSREAWISTRLWRRGGCAFTTCGPKWPDWQKSLSGAARSMLARSHERPGCRRSLGSRGSDCETALPSASISNSLWLVVCYEAGVFAFDQATNLVASGMLAGSFISVNHAIFRIDSHCGTQWLIELCLNMYNSVQYELYIRNRNAHYGAGRCVPEQNPSTLKVTAQRCGMDSEHAPIFGLRQRFGPYCAQLPSRV
jgi:hypothetical protein